MRYVTWVGKVFHALVDVGRRDLGGGVDLPAIGSALGFEGLTDDAFVGGTEPARALMTEMYDLEAIGLVEFQNVGYGNGLTADGRHLLNAGLGSAWPEIFGIPASEFERTFLARLYSDSAENGDGWADLRRGRGSHLRPVRPPDWRARRHSRFSRSSSFRCSGSTTTSGAGSRLRVGVLF